MIDHPVPAAIRADLIVLPILDIYRKYYGLRLAGFLLVTFYVAIGRRGAFFGRCTVQCPQACPSGAASPSRRRIGTVEHTTWLNLGFLMLAALLAWRFLKTGDPDMLRMMNHPMQHGAGMGHLG